MAKRRDIPPPKGYERSPRDPNLIRKIVAQAPLTIAQAIWPNLRSEVRPTAPQKNNKQGAKR
jgi:hypothetical protein